LSRKFRKSVDLPGDFAWQSPWTSANVTARVGRSSDVRRRAGWGSAAPRWEAKLARKDDRDGPPGTSRIDRLLEAAGAALEEGRPADALARAEEAAAADPRSAAALHYRAAALEELARWEDARLAYARALSVGKDDAELLLGAARFLVEGLPEEEQDRADLDEGLALARRGVKLAARAGDAELEVALRIVEARAFSGLGHARDALAAIAQAERAAPEDAEVLLEKGLALYELDRFEEAETALLAAEAAAPQGPEAAWVLHALGLVAERRGEVDEARRRFARARKLAPEDFPPPISLSAQEFEAAVEAALAELPEPVRRYLANVAISVEDLPAEADLLASDPPLSPGILGLFRGAPWGQKASMDPWSHFPSAIVLYQRNLERFARTREELVEEIRITLVHEVGHFLGLDEDELYERGLE
jgi:predicted Zn-dependent protease with MMP-like domain/Flp pilus assembly protein TadD